MTEDELVGGFAGMLWDELEARADLDCKEAVAEALRRMGEDAGVWQSGGGVHVVTVRRPEGTYMFGTLAPTWTGALYGEGDEPVEGADFDLGIASGSRDAGAIAAAIVDAVHRRGP